MLDSLLAQKLAKKIMKQLGYNINIMNEKGIIIASGDSQRIGDFHEIAYKVITEKLDIEIVHKEDEHYIGVKSGVNMPILYDNRIVGVVGISGDPESIKDFAYIVRLSVETMLEYELYKQQIQKRRNTKNVLLNALLYEEPIDVRKINSLAEELGYHEPIIRIPILMKFLTKESIASVQDLIKNSTFHRKQDISMAVGDNYLLVFKTVSSNSIIGYRNTLLSYIENINIAMACNNYSSQSYYYIGTPQSRFEHFRQAYQHVSWLEKYVAYRNTNVFFFMDFTADYIHNSVSFDVYENIFSCYAGILDQLGENLFTVTVEALLKNNMNINKAAQELFLHRNTVMFRLNKIKDAFGIDPINNMFDRELISNLFYFNKKRPKK